MKCVSPDDINEFLCLFVHIFDIPHPWHIFILRLKVTLVACSRTLKSIYVLHLSTLHPPIHLTIIPIHWVYALNVILDTIPCPLTLSVLVPYSFCKVASPPLSGSWLSLLPVSPSATGTCGLKQLLDGRMGLYVLLWLLYGGNRILKRNI